MAVSHYIFTEKPGVEGWRVMILDGHRPEAEAIWLAKQIIEDMTGYKPTCTEASAESGDKQGVAILSHPQSLHAALLDVNGDLIDKEPVQTLDEFIANMMALAGVKTATQKTKVEPAVCHFSLGSKFQGEGLQVPVTAVQVAGNKLAEILTSQGLEMKVPLNWQHKIMGNG